LSTLTKIFIVLLVIFCIAFTMSSISFVAQTQDWRALAEGFEQEAQTSDTYLRNVLASSAAQMAMDRDAINAHIARIGELEKEREETLTRIAECQTQLGTARAEVTSLDGTVRLLAGELKVGQAGWAELRKHRDELVERNLELEKRNIDLNERVNEQTAQLLVLQQNVRQLEQQAHLLRQEGKRLSQYQQRAAEGEIGALAEAGPAAARPLTPAAASPIRGHITDVSGSLATISVGSADGVSEGMVFVIYRGLDYIGDMKITHIEPNQAAGRILRSKGTPRVDDRVADEAVFGMAP
jgi:hypothetical protein